ncbi:MAG: hypothetical protein CL607_23135 [Anaerolineaceae bacterium]|nr:hypothetical protein [Anaerolineaceae bacterium]
MNSSTKIEMQLSELREQVASLQQENERLLLENATFDAIADGILVIGSNGNIVRMNAAFIDMWQLTPDVLESWHTHEDMRSWIIDQIHPDTTTEALQKILAPVDQTIGLIDITLKNDKVFEQFAGAKRINDEIMGYVWTFRDVTDRRHAEIRLRRNQQFLQRVIRDAPVILYTIDSEGIITFSQGRALKRLGLAEGELVGQSIYELYKDHPIIEHIKWALNGETTRGTFDFDGIYLEAYVAPMFNDAEEQSGVIGISMDVTDKLRAREALEYARELREAKEAAETARRDAEAANVAKSTFLANMSHELRTPLNSIIGFSQFLVRDEKLNVEQREYVSLISRSSDHLLTLINDILDMSKIESGRSQLDPMDFDLWEMLEYLDSMYYANAGSKGLEYVSEYSSTLPRYARGDRGKIRQILVNLLSNAVKFTYEGTITIRAHPESLPGVSNDQFTVVFEVEDTGTGIDAADLETLFEPFVQARDGKKQMGTGLGLAICREFATMMQGDIMVQSEVGKGSCFTVRIVLEKAMTETTTLRPKRKGQQRVVGIAPDQPNYSMLVVDDKWENRLMLVRMLQKIGFTVYQADNGKEAIEKWKKYKPDLLWMDMRMPVMDGYEATRAIRQEANGDDSPKIIALTASAFEHERRKVITAGCNDFMAKPFHENDLFEKITQHLGVTFVYEDDNELPVDETTTKLPKITLKPSEVSEETRDLLIRAAESLSFNDVQRAVALIPEDLELLKRHINQLAQEFDFGAIIDLLNEDK